MSERYEHILEENANLKRAVASTKAILERQTSKLPPSLPNQTRRLRHAEANSWGVKAAIRAGQEGKWRADCQELPAAGRQKGARKPVWLHHPQPQDSDRAEAARNRGDLGQGHPLLRPRYAAHKDHKRTGDSTPYAAGGQAGRDRAVWRAAVRAEARTGHDGPEEREPQKRNGARN